MKTAGEKIVAEDRDAQAAALDVSALANANVARHLPQMAKRVPRLPGIVVPHYDRTGRFVSAETLTFSELEAYSNRVANGLIAAGVERGLRTLLMVKPGKEFVAITFALLKIGAVPVLIDPGMGVGRLLDCVRDVRVEALIGIPQAQVVRMLRAAPFRDVRAIVTAGSRFGWGGFSLDRLLAGASADFEPAPVGADESAAILFTSGSTGPAKGVVYTHGMFGAQVDAIQRLYDIRPGEIDLPALPVFVLFSTAMGMSAVIPQMNASKPSTVDPAIFADTIRRFRVTNTFGSPAIWKKVSAYCESSGERLPSIKRILIAGAPVPPSVIARLRTAIDPAADVHTPYGATESLPVSSISGSEILDFAAERTRRGGGTCVGRPVPEVELRIIRISDEPIDAWSDDLLVADGEFGELVVAGEMVTREYFGKPEATRDAKIHEGDRIWHRIGDIGYRDENGRIWFCGRKSHRVRTSSGEMYTVCCEAIFNEHPRVARSALVGAGEPGHQKPVLVAELDSGKLPRRREADRLRDELRQMGSGHEHTRAIETFLFRKALPVDVRHNAKIHREEIAAWAARRLR